MSQAERLAVARSRIPAAELTARGRVLNVAETSYSLRDLIGAASTAERLTVSERAVWHYIAEGLLPPPRGRGPAASYSEEHLAQLRMVLRLVNQYVPPAEIRRWMQNLSGGQLHALLDRPAVPRLPADAAHIYLARLLKTLPPPPPRTPPARTSPPPVARAAPPAPARAPRPAPVARPASPLEPVPERSVWLRVAVHPDVELLVRAHGTGIPAQVIDRLVAALEAILLEEDDQAHA